MQKAFQEVASKSKDNFLTGGEFFVVGEFSNNTTRRVLQAHDDTDTVLELCKNFSRVRKFAPLLLFGC